uniref:hypothetical protein n=1 Tax=Microbulbifer variabilis TaxID=266805 RepID=UPI0005918185
AGNVGFSAARVIAAAIVGGTASAVSGGKFANGAITAAFSRAFNEENHPTAEKKISKRNLSAGEREVAIRVHPDLLESELDSITIDFSLDMECGGNSGKGCGGFTPYRQINLPKSLAHCADLTVCDGGAYIDLFNHELTHAWTNINSRNFLGLSGSIRGFISNGAAANPVGGYLPYKDYLNTPAPVGLNSEQMADWFMWFDKDRRQAWGN